MCGFIEGHDHSLTNDTEMNSFISQCNHGTHIHSTIYFDRANPDNAHKYTVSQIANTITQVLIDHPPPKSNRPFSNRSTTNPYNKQQRSISQLGSNEEIAIDINNLSLSPSAVDVYVHALDAAVNAIQKDPSLVTDRPCIICRFTNPDDTNHTFKECKYLHNDPHCRSMYIKVMNLFNAILKEQARVSETEQKKTINSIQAFFNERAEQDFQDGNNDS